MASFCESCGAQLAAGARFCTGCGKPVAAAAPAAPVAPSPPQYTPPPPHYTAPAPPPPPWSAPVAPAPRRGGNPLLKILAGVVVLIVAVVTCALLVTSGPADAVTAHLNALAKGDDAAAYALTSSGFRGETSASQFTAFVNANPILRTGKFSIGEREVSGDQGSVTVEMTATDGSTRTVDFQLINENDKWLITGYRVRAAGTSSPGGPAPAAAKPLVPCSSAASAKVDPQAVLALAPKTAIRLLTAAKDPKDAQGKNIGVSSYADSKVRTFSIAEQRAPKPDTQTVHLIYWATTDNSADLPRHDLEIEVCDADGKTASTHGTANPSTSTNIIGTDVTVTGSNAAPDKPGTYRIDAYVWLEQTKTWYLVARMEGVTFGP